MTGSAAPLPEPRVSVVVVSYNTRDDLLRCLDALARSASLPCETVVVDNASADGSAAAVRARFPDVQVLENPDNLGFSAANNRGIRATRAPCVLILNSDAELCPGSLPALLAALESRPDVGVVGPRTVGTDGSPQVSFGPDLTPLAEWRQRRLVRGVRERRPWALREAAAASREPGERAWVSASCLLARRTALEAVGGFDEQFFLYEEDVDLCLRLRRAGWRVLYAPEAEVVHHLGRSMAQAADRARLEYHRSHLLFYRKHNGPLRSGLLRGYLAVSAALGWLGALLGGAARSGERRHRGRLVRLALRGR